MSLLLCPLCHHADAIRRSEFPAVGPGVVQAAAVTLSINVCGRCGHSVAMAAVSAAELHLAALRKKAGK